MRRPGDDTEEPAALNLVAQDAVLETAVDESAVLAVDKEVGGSDPAAWGTVGHADKGVTATEHGGNPKMEGILSAKPPHSAASPHRILAGTIVAEALPQVSHHVIAQLHIPFGSHQATHVIDGIQQIVINGSGSGKTQLGILSTGTPVLVFDDTGMTFSHLAAHHGGATREIGVDGVGMVKAGVTESQVMKAVGSLVESGTLGTVVEVRLLQGTTESLRQRAAMQPVGGVEVNPISCFQPFRQ